MKKLLILFYMIFLIQGVLIYADEPGETTFYLGEIVVTAPRDEGDEKSRIESKTLKTHKVVDLAEILSDEMVEATMIRKGAYGNEVAIRGFGQSNLRVLIDDGLLEGACGSRKDPSLSHINRLTVDKIEVRQGPFDVTKAGALGGSINVVTKKPEKGFHSEIITKGGSYDFLSSGFYLTGGNKFIQGLIGYNYSESDQYEDGNGNKLYSFAPGGRPYNVKGRDMKAFKKQDVWGKLQLTPKENQTILFSHTCGDAEDIMAPRVRMDMEDEKTYLSKGSYIITDMGNSSKKLSFSFYRNKIEHNPYDKYRILAGAPPFHLHNDVESTITGGKIENEQLTEFAMFTYGIDIYKRNWQGDMYRDDTGTVFDDELIPDVDTYNYGLYGKADKYFDKWSLSIGLRYDRFETKADENL
ncbi:MAG: TonB-dependent receptor plug domain-containing protein, partial [Thermodesulfobacteriota bacterium]|nr:TonB-dependent receptor plug domain-containing protein [Thermodesulfobacteriota bacterium]